MIWDRQHWYWWDWSNWSNWYEGSTCMQDWHVGLFKGPRKHCIINVSKCSCICRYCSASCFWPLKISFRISGWLSDKAASKLSWIGLTGDSQTMDCGDSPEICSAKSGTTALRWGGLACSGLYRETTVVCKF